VPPETGLRINLGCGARWQAGWKNVDGGPPARLVWLRRLRVFDRLLPRITRLMPQDVLVVDLRRTPLPFEDRCASVIFSGYVLEYLTREETERLLRDCLRILQPGGLLRLCQADIRPIAEQYLAGVPGRPGVAALENADRFLRLASPEHTKWSVRLFRRGGVQQLFDRPSLQYMLEQAGFTGVASCGPLEGECPDLEAIERSDDVQEAPLIRVEARKPR
jgi:SAM-dependent methyltransferase